MSTGATSRGNFVMYHFLMELNLPHVITFEGTYVRIIFGGDALNSILVVTTEDMHMVVNINVRVVLKRKIISQDGFDLPLCSVVRHLWG